MRQRDHAADARAFPEMGPGSELQKLLDGPQGRALGRPAAFHPNQAGVGHEQVYAQNLPLEVEFRAANALQPDARIEQGTGKPGGVENEDGEMMNSPIDSEGAKPALLSYRMDYALCFHPCAVRDAGEELLHFEVGWSGKWLPSDHPQVRHDNHGREISGPAASLDVHQVSGPHGGLLVALENQVNPSCSVLHERVSGHRIVVRHHTVQMDRIAQPGLVFRERLHLLDLGQHRQRRRAAAFPGQVRNGALDHRPRAALFAHKSQDLGLRRGPDGLRLGGPQRYGARRIPQQQAGLAERDRATQPDAVLRKTGAILRQNRANGPERDIRGRGRRLYHSDVSHRPRPDLHADGNAAGVKTRSQRASHPDHRIDERAVVRKRQVSHADADIPAESVQHQHDLSAVIDGCGCHQPLDLDVTELQVPRDQVLRVGPRRFRQRAGRAAHDEASRAHHRAHPATGHHPGKFDRESRLQRQARHGRALHADGAGRVLHQQQQDRSVGEDYRRAKMGRDLRRCAFRSELAHLFHGGQSGVLRVARRPRTAGARHPNRRQNHTRSQPALAGGAGGSTQRGENKGLWGGVHFLGGQMIRIHPSRRLSKNSAPSRSYSRSCARGRPPRMAISRVLREH